MKISVIIPSYKPGDYIWECLESIKNQTLPKEDFEVILVLNGCNEPYYSQIKEWLSSNLCGFNINFIQTDIGGVSNARNIALDIAKGDYITFIDDDDYISSQYLEGLYEKVSPDTISLSYAYAFNDIEPNVQLPYYLTKVYDEYHSKSDNKLSSKVRKYFSGPCMKLIHKSIIEERRFNTNFKNGEDSLFMFLISDRIDRVSFASKESIYYRRFRANSAALKKRRTKERFKNNINCIIEYTKIYFSGKYSTYFFLSRIAAEIRCIINLLLGK